MTQKLKTYFPDIRQREELLGQIHGNAALERMEELLSLLLGQNVRILKVLPQESRIAAEDSLLILDIVVELADGSIANVEVQKIGYAFPGQRAACYSSDLLLRQYKRVKSERKKLFSYRDIRPVYTIVLFEESPREFRSLPDRYLHRSRQVFDTGLEMDLLQKYVFVSLDNFRRLTQNKDIETKLEAWLHFLSRDEPEEIIRLIRTYPEFRPLYEEVYRLCQDTERVMHMFSKELEELDRNTVQYMIDEMQDEIDGMKEAMDGMKDELGKKDAALAEQETALREKDAALQEALQEQKTALQERDAALQEKDAEIQALRRELQALKEQ